VRGPSLHRTLTDNYAPQPNSVPSYGQKSHKSIRPHTLANLFGLGRLAVGGAFFVSPVTSVRVLGLDTASAKRMAFLARMAAARDIVLGAGALMARDPRSKAGWIAAGAASDVADSLVIGAAVKDGTARGVPAVIVVAGAAGAGLLGFWAAAGLRGARGLG
jgi:hypothetical protein